ncbi:MAG: GEVED domain-containing protein, partial [Bacteroidota bacterium]
WLVNGFRGENQANSGGHSWVATYSNWETVDISTSSITNLKAGTFEQSRANAELAFLGDESGNKLFMTNDLSSATPTWTELTNAPAATRYRIATHPYNENLVAIATNIGVYVSKDKGQTWTQRGTFPETQPRVILLDRNKSEGIYVMTALTVYYMDENLTNWAEYNKGQPLQKNNDMRMAYYADGDHRLYVSKYGMGVWATPLQSALEANNELAFADFRIHGESSNNIQQGESVRLTDLSLGADSISWRLENGTDIINIGNIREPSAQLNTLGYYQVTQFAYNAAGTRTAVKTNYIKVIAPLPTLACTPLNDGNTEWYRHFRTIKMDEEAYNVSGSTAYYIESGYTFTINSGQATTLYMDDSYQPGFNQYMYAWIDYNNNGDFEDAGEQIAASPTQVDTLIQMFTPPASAVVNEPIQMRVMKTDNSSPTSCYTTNNRQIIEFAIEIRTNVNFTAQSHQMLTQNSATLDATYTDGMNVLEAGFVYSLFDADLNLENANRVSASSTLSDDDSYSIPISDLSLGGTYYYRPYVIDDSGISYGAIQSFQLSAYESPLVEALEARFLGNDQWELTGTLYVGTNTNINATFQHGLGNFNTSTAATLPTINAGDEVTIQTIVTAPMSMNNYQFR